MKTLTFFIMISCLFAFTNLWAQDNAAVINPVLTDYFGVEKALTKDNSKAANTSAAELVKEIKKVNIKALNDTQKMVWNKYSEALRYNAQHISESKSIDHQREHFASLSNDMYALLKTFKPGTTVYRQYCPMKKQSWLNPTENIENPYYGKSMPDCGKVTETIPGGSK